MLGLWASDFQLSGFGLRIPGFEALGFVAVDLGIGRLLQSPHRSVKYRNHIVGHVYLTANLEFACK